MTCVAEVAVKDVLLVQVVVMRRQSKLAVRATARVKRVRNMKSLLSIVCCDCCCVICCVCHCCCDQGCHHGCLCSLLGDGVLHLALLSLLQRFLL